jgi:DNA polymerase I
MPDAKTLYLIDGSGFIFRAYHALPPLTSPEGTPVGAVLGFVNMILKLTDDHKGDYVAVIFDAARKTFRNRIYADYKAHRPPPPDDLIPQFAIVREATEAFCLPAIELADYEADDIIATYTKQARAQGMNVVIVSSDKDLMQLIGDGVAMFDAMKQKVIGPAEVTEKFGVPPDKVRDVLALIGDSSDNVPGVPGVGPKTAAELILRFGGIESVLTRCSEITQNKRRETLTANCEQARISYELIGLKDDVAVPVPLEELKACERQPEKLIGFCQKYGLKSVMMRLQQKHNVPAATIMATVPAGLPAPRTPALPAPGAVEKHYTLILDEATLARWIEQARIRGIVAFDTETTSLNPEEAELVGFSLASSAGVACYVPLQHKGEGSNAPVAPQSDLFAAAPRAIALVPGQIPLARALELIKPLLEDDSVLKIGHHIKYDMRIMQRYGVGITPIEDTMLLGYVLHAGEHGAGMDELAERYLNYKTISYDEVTGTGRNRLPFDRVEIEKAGQYAAEDADITLRLYELFKPQLAGAQLATLYETIERPLVPVLTRMETAGIKVDVAQLAGLSKDFAARMADYERQICGHAGCEFNVGSPKQLGEILFEKMQLSGGRKSAKTGAYSTDNDVLEELAAGGSEIAAKVIEWRQLAKLKSTYSDTLAEQIDSNHRVHTCFAQAIASTGRLSSSDPNLQNIPIRTEEGKKIRCAFIAEPGYHLLSADYSQIELRLLAHMADIETLKTAFRNGDDIHAITASQMFGVPVSAVNADLRRKAKTINFGIIYGISAHGLAARLGIGRSEAGNYIEQYFTQYPGIRDYMESARAFARAHGYVMTLFGRRCHMPGILDKNAARRQFFERAAINAPLQGTAADIIKRAMIDIDAKLGTSADTRMLLQVHDELVFEVREDRVGEITALVKDLMEHAAALSVPLTVETGAGKHWGEAH